MFNLPHIPTAQGLIDKAFRRGAKIAKAARSTSGPREKRMRKSDDRLILTTSKIIESDLKAIIKNFPSYEQLPEFYQQLLDIKIDKNRYKKSLGAVQWCLTNNRKLKEDTVRNIRRSNYDKSGTRGSGGGRDKLGVGGRESKGSRKWVSCRLSDKGSISGRMGDSDSGEDFSKERTGYVREFLGRSASFINAISDDLDILIEIKSILRGFPGVDDMPTLVIAGYPNVGKSTFMRNLTGSKVKIASYPFTTQDILIGHKKIKYQQYQIIDSPGLLDRPMDDRNKIELQAILAIKELADVILFIIDPKMDIVPQVSLLSEIKNNFTTRILVVINKIDLVTAREVDKIKLKIKEELVNGEALEELLLTEISATNEADCNRVFETIFG